MRVRIEGKSPVGGIYAPSGNSNAAQALVAAALLASEPVTLRQFPRTHSALGMLDHAAQIGVEIAWLDVDSVSLNARQLARRTIVQGEADASVGALLLIAPLLARRQYARLELDFPLNRIRTHLEALRDLGIDIAISDNAVDLKAARWDTRDIVLSQTSVTATAISVILAASLGRETRIRNAASEPHIGELCRMLGLMGAQIGGIDSNLLTVTGASDFAPADVRLSCDYIEAASVAAICALTGGRAQIQPVCAGDFPLIAKTFGRLGLTLEPDGDSLFVPKHDQIVISSREEDVDSSIETAPWPGFPSDLVAVATVAATQARGTTLIHEKLFSNRLLFVDKLKAMGAQIVLCDPHRAIIVGASPLRAIYFDSPDVRTGLGMVAAALCADGVSVIDNAEALDFAFADVLHKLTGLNARISFE